MTNKEEIILSYLEEYYADAKCSLDYKNPFECLVAILLSAQTTDKSVNQVTPVLFSIFPTPEAMSIASIEEVENDIKAIGLYHNKAKNIIALSRRLVTDFAGKIPSDKEILTSLPGVGNKTAGVYLLEIEKVPAIPVDTHLRRVSYRLGYAKTKDMDPSLIEKKLEKAFPKEKWIYLHHALIHFGRNECHANNPDCTRCAFKGFCRYFKKNSSTKGK
ncbi:MAG: endonuclease III [Bacilli bacterium]|nr:endonuclease III [Bacilli bacterium]